MPKRSLAGTLNLPLGEGRLAISPGPEATTLRAELEAFKPRISLAADPDDTWRESPGDALVLAVGCACWWGETFPAPRYPVELAAAWGDLPASHAMRPR